MSDPRSVLILAGGLSHERDVSLRSGRRVAESLRDVGLDVEIDDVGPNFVQRLTDHDADVVWPLLHGATGEDGALRDVLELAGASYVGSRPGACRKAWDKPVATSLLAEAGAHTPLSIALPHGLFRELGAKEILSLALERLGLPLVVKPARGGSALGVTVVRSPQDLPRAMVDCFAYGDVAILEEFVAGVEVAVTVVELEGKAFVLPAVEIVADGGSYNYDARYVAGATEFFTPARLTTDTTAEVSRVALLAHESLGLRHLSRSDLIVRADGTVCFLEVNVAPGMTETSLMPQAVSAAGFAQGDLYRKLVVAAHNHRLDPLHP